MYVDIDMKYTKVNMKSIYHRKKVDNLKLIIYYIIKHSCQNEYSVLLKLVHVSSPFVIQIQLNNIHTNMHMKEISLI